MSTISVIGAWSKAGIGSSIKVQGLSKAESILFDCGLLTTEGLNCNSVFITHGHIDHVGACISHARARAISFSPASYYVPYGVYDALLDAKLAFEKMDGAPIPMNIFKISPGESVHVTAKLRVATITSVHRVESQGYAVFSIKKGSLRQELSGLSKDEIRTLKLSGESISDPDTESLEFVYTGDTTIEMFKLPENEFILSVPKLVVELTYIDGDRAKASQRGHIHIDDIIENAAMFDAVQELIFVHFSQKYSMSQILAVLQEKLPTTLQRKVKCSLHSFGATEALTALDDPRYLPEVTSNIVAVVENLSAS
eukprot:gene26322-34950_t